MYTGKILRIQYALSYSFYFDCLSCPEGGRSRNGSLSCSSALVNSCCAGFFEKTLKYGLWR
jgi:hypothetical protein